MLSIFKCAVRNSRWHYLLLKWLFCFLNCSQCYNSKRGLRQNTFKLKFQTVSPPLSYRLLLNRSGCHWDAQSCDAWRIPRQHTIPHAVKDWGPRTAANKRKAPQFKASLLLHTLPLSASPAFSLWPPQHQNTRSPEIKQLSKLIPFCTKPHEVPSFLTSWNE
jgi:hypothetical protein